MNGAAPTRIATAALTLAVAAACTTPAAGPHPHPRAKRAAVSHAVTVTAGGAKVDLEPVTPASLGCAGAARALGYALPCPAHLPRAVLGGYGICDVSHFMQANPCGNWPHWMAATGGGTAPLSGSGAATPANTEHFVMEGLPYATTNYDAVANGPGWQNLIVPGTVHALGWITIHGFRMRWITVAQNLEGSVMAGHIMLVWSAASHTYALGFHNFWGNTLTRALDIAVAQSLVMIPPRAMSRG
jgi:hypothetical protein